MLPSMSRNAVLAPFWLCASSCASVSLQFGDFRAGGEVLEANRTRMGQQWISAAGGAAEPLVQIDGSELQADGRFVDMEMTAEPVDGRLTATCDRR